MSIFTGKWRVIFFKGSKSESDDSKVLEENQNEINEIEQVLNKSDMKKKKTMILDKSDMKAFNSKVESYQKELREICKDLK